ncbi:metallophosphoesterase [Streptomyces sp. NRRL F-5727]|uniref:metallophosphoesterase n=1 Tax=Streptomyces sp. NRRL F-5727 TaxID=1463871 RepID=UPI0004C97EE3|nr:metallophosphoesterase [Streptomyces sp. NRRL F-5727]
MTQGAGQDPVERTATLRDFRVPPYARVPVQGHPAEPPAAPVPPTAPVPPADPTLQLGTRPAAFPDPVGFPSPGARQEPVTHQEPPARPEPLARPEPAAYPAPAPLPEAPAPYAEPGVTVTAAHSGGYPDEFPDGYTPTARDLPVIQRGDTLQVPVAPAAAPAPAPAGDGPGPLYVVGDVHGYLDELVAALRAQGLVDENGGWAAGNARLWFLGDFTDRGPDGIGVIDLVMRLSAEAAAAGGYCKALMGNHELLLIGAKRFGDTPVNSGAGTATFQAAWLLNGGQKHDMDRLQDVHLQWMSRLDAVVHEDGHLLLHSDTTAYLDYGQTIEDVNETVHEILRRNDADEVWDLFRKFTKRFAFRDESGPQAVQELLGTYGGSRVVHGHSPIPYLLGQVGTEDGEEDSRPAVDGPHVYADGLAIAMDGGVTMAGKLLVVQLPLGD